MAMAGVLIYGIPDAPKLAPGSDESDTLMCSIEVPTTCPTASPLGRGTSRAEQSEQESRKQKGALELWQLVKLVVLSIAPPSGALHSPTAPFQSCTFLSSSISGICVAMGEVLWFYY